MNNKDKNFRDKSQTKEISPRRLNEARYKLSLTEQRIIIAVISRISGDTNGPLRVIIPLNELIKSCRLDRDNGLNIIRNSVKAMMRRTLDFQNENDENWRVTSWLYNASYDAERKAMIFELDEHLHEDFMNLRKIYAASTTDFIMSFQHEYTPKIYSFLKEKNEPHSYSFSLEFFMETFALPSSYKENFTHFRKKFLEPCLREINEKSDLNVIHEYIKEGKRYVKIRLAVVPKKMEQMPSEVEDVPLHWTDEEKVILIRLTNPARWGLEKTLAEKLLRQYGAAQIKQSMEYAALNRREGSLSEWLLECVENGYAADEPKQAPPSNKTRPYDVIITPQGPSKISQGTSTTSDEIALQRRTLDKLRANLSARGKKLKQ